MKHACLTALLLLASTTAVVAGGPMVQRGEQADAPMAPGALQVGRVVATDVFLGVEGRPITPEEIAACECHFPEKSGLVITRVVPGSPAEEAGLREGDILLTISGSRIRKPADVLMSMRYCNPGTPLHLSILRVRDKRREGQPKMRRMPLVARPVKRGEPVYIGRIEARTINPSPETAREIERHQSAIVRHLTAKIPDKEAIYAEFDAISALLPENPMPGHLRLYYTSRGEMLTITRRPGEHCELEIALHYPNGQMRHICSLGYALTPEFRRRFIEMALEQEKAREASAAEPAPAAPQPDAPTRAE